MDPEVQAFIDALAALCREHGATIIYTTMDNGLHVQVKDHPTVCIGFDPQKPEITD